MSTEHFARWTAAMRPEEVTAVDSYLGALRELGHPHRKKPNAGNLTAWANPLRVLAEHQRHNPSTKAFTTYVADQLRRWRNQQPTTHGVTDDLGPVPVPPREPRRPVHKRSTGKTP